MFYVAVPFFVHIFRRFGRLPVLVACYILSVAYSQYFGMLAAKSNSGIYAEIARQLPGQLCYFLAGALIFYYLEAFERHIKIFVFASVAVLMVDVWFLLPLFEPVALAVLVGFFGLFLYMGNFGKYGDFSYGVYILHFPIIQLFIYFGWFGDFPLLYLLSVVVVVLIGAIAMWHIVEKRFLLRKNHYVATAASA